MSFVNETITSDNFTVIAYSRLHWSEAKPGYRTTNTVNATVSIKFYGTKISAYGDILPDKSISCQLDNRLPLPNFDHNEPDLCNAVDLGPEQHNFTITFKATNTSFSFKQFIVWQTVVPSSSTYNLRLSIPISSSTTMTSSSPKRTYNQPFQSNPTTSSSITVSSPPAVESTTASSRNRGQLIGATVGGLTLLTIVATLVVWIIKRRRNANRWKAPSAMFGKYNPYWEMREI